MHFLRLIRPVNLIIIAFTMYSTRLFLYIYEQLFKINLFQKGGEEFDFFLIVFSTVLIAAAGNIINDYFDVRADRINKPEKLIITKHINRKWAILSHWVLNVIAFGIAIYLSARNNTFWYMFIHLLSINALWFYSMYFKRKPFIGNFIVATLTALVPILCGIHFYIHHELPTIELENINTPFAFWIYHLMAHGHYILILALFAFASNLAREIIKDIEDIEGDKLLHAKTLPILYGVSKSKWMAGLLLILSPILFSLLFFLKIDSSSNLIENIRLFIPVLGALFLDIISIVLLIIAKSRKELKRVDLMIKIAMLLGLSLPFYWILVYSF
jgi:4-hydroxybenzoate polyprenyltransferase